MTEKRILQLMAEKERISEEIRAYPGPIPVCDAQFNYLLERRREIESALTGRGDPSDLRRPDTSGDQDFTPRE